MQKIAMVVAGALVGVAVIGGVAASQRRGGNDNGGDSSELASLESQYQQLSQQAGACEQQINENMGRVAQAAMNGEMYQEQPPCEAYMAGWAADAAVLEKRIYNLQHGTHLEVRDFALPGTTGETGTSADHPDYDTTAVREHGHWVDEQGNDYELPLAPYYFRDRASGQIVPSELADPPADGRDWEVLQPRR